jgi:AraC-like DNA-binding protein
VIKASDTYAWAGFDKSPNGVLFEQLVTVEGEMGVAYERSLRFEKTPHVHDRLLLVFPRQGTSMRVRTTDPAAAYVVSSSELLAVPAELEHDDSWVTEVYDTFALLPAPSLIKRAALAIGVEESVLGNVVHVARTAWLEALLGEYFADRVLRSAMAGPRHAALEELIMIEVLRLATGDGAADSPSERAGPSSVVARALRYIEGRLFSEIDLEDMCRACGASRSSLLRHFRREIGTTPKAYLLGRRLDEAKRLLEVGRYGVGDVAGLVGYESAGAFSEAFRRRFSVPPSVVSKVDG